MPSWVFRGGARGHTIVSYDGETWVYEDDDTPHDDRRPCAECGMTPAYWQSPDPCLGRLPGVEWACCGHGGRMRSYVIAGGITYSPIEMWRAIYRARVLTCVPTRGTLDPKERNRGEVSRWAR